MRSEDDNDQAGIPLMAPRYATEPSQVIEKPSTVVYSGRDAADEPLPLGNPKTITEVLPEVRIRRDAERGSLQLKRASDEARQLDAAESASVVRRILRSISIAAAALIVGIAGLVLWTQLVQAIQVLGTWSSWSWGLGWSGFAACCLLIAGSVGRMLWFGARFKRNRPITRRLLEERAHMRELGVQLRAEARGQLRQYMEQFPANDARHREFLRGWGVEDSDWEMMNRNRAELLNGDNRQDFSSWQNTFGTCFLGPLDAAANRIVKRYAVLTAIKTAICPYALLDMAIVIYMGTSMIGSLCKVYRLRAGPLDMVYLFGLVMSQSLFADQFEEHSQEAASWLGDSTSNVLDHIGIALPDMAANLFSKLAVKGGQGLSNALLLNRIGQEACKLMRPLSFDS